MSGTITIHLETSDEETWNDVVRLLELQLPYMGDNVVVTSAVAE